MRTSGDTTARPTENNGTAEENIPYAKENFRQSNY